MFDVPNLDDMSVDPKDLLDFANAWDEKRPTIGHADHVHYLAVAQYARLKAGVMQDRLEGNIPAAMTQEAWCDRIYRRMPQWAKW